MNAASVLIVGAGAMGMVSGYHLSLGGTRITYLVRPGRIEAFQAPQRLYCHDDAQIKVFDGYRVIDRVADMGSEIFDYVIVTLDGATSRSEQTTAMLRELGQAILPQKTRLLIGGVGVGLREHYLQTTGLPAERVLNSALALLSHKVSAGLPLHPSTPADVIAQASLVYHHFPNRVSFFVDSTNPAAAREFAALYDRSGVSRCAVMNKTLFSIMTNAAFPMLAASEIAGWPNIDDLVAHRELWHLSCRAQNEITALPEHGWIGRLLSLIMSDRISAAIQRKVEKDSSPLPYQAFNRYHHGDKVQAQDVQVMRNCVDVGRRAGRPMSALSELLDRLAAHQRQQGKTPA